jgi:hypothetical protein
MPEEFTRGPERDFSSLDDVEVEQCWRYEFTRLLPGLVRRVSTWREQVPRKEGQDLFDAYCSHQGWQATSFLQMENSLFLIPPGAYYLFPEWPNTAYLNIPPEIRFRRLMKLGEIEKSPEPQETANQAVDSGGESENSHGGRGNGRKVQDIIPRPAEYGLAPVSHFDTEKQVFDKIQWDESSWKKLIASFTENILRSNEIRAFRSNSGELVLFRIAWAQSDKHLLASFSEWLSLNRPVPFEKHGTLGRSRPQQKRRDELEHLRKYLIVQDAGDWKVKVGRRPLFRDRSRWNDCRKAVEKILTDLGSYPGCTI